MINRTASCVSFFPPNSTWIWMCVATWMPIYVGIPTSRLPSRNLDTSRPPRWISSPLSLWSWRTSTSASTSWMRPSPLSPRSWRTSTYTLWMCPSPLGLCRTPTPTSWMRPSSPETILFRQCHGSLRSSLRIWHIHLSTSQAQQFPTLLAPLTPRGVNYHHSQRYLSRKVSVMTCIYIDFDQLHCSSTPISNMSSTIDIFAAAYVVRCVIFDNGLQFCCLLPIPPPFGRRPTTDSAFQPSSCATPARIISFEDKTKSSPTWKGQKQ